MRPLWTLRWLLLAILLYFWPVEQPTEEELIAYGKEQERTNPLTGTAFKETPEYIAMIRTQEIAAINAETAKELQRYIDSRKQQQAHYEQPERVTEPMRLHAIHLRRIETEEMTAVFKTADTDKWLLT